MVNDENDPPLVSTKNVWMLRDSGGSDKNWKGKLEARSGYAWCQACMFSVILLGVMIDGPLLYVYNKTRKCNTNRCLV